MIIPILLSYYDMRVVMNNKILCLPKNFVFSYCLDNRHAVLTTCSLSSKLEESIPSVEADK